MFVVLPEVNTNLPFDVNEFVPIGFVAEQPYALLASNKLDVNSTSDLIEYSKKQPGGLDTVAGTRGGLQHLTVEWFRKRSGAKLNMIHYPGPAQAMNDFITGRVPMMMQTLAPVAGVISAGEASCWRSPRNRGCRTITNTPTVAETFRASPPRAGRSWSRRRARPLTSSRKINRDLRAALARPDIIRKIEQQGNYTRPMSPQQLAEFVRSERAIWVPIVKRHRHRGGALSFDHG